MKSGEAFQRFESDTQLLKRISEQYAATSPEFQALQRAAWSLAYIMMNHQNEFAAFLEEMDSNLSDEQRQQLHDRYGIES